MPYPKRGTKRYKELAEKRGWKKGGGGKKKQGAAIDTGAQPAEKPKPKRKYKRRNINREAPSPSTAHLKHFASIGGGHESPPTDMLDKVQPHSAEGRIRIGTANLLMKQATSLLSSISSSAH